MKTVGERIGRGSTCSTYQRHGENQVQVSAVIYSCVSTAGTPREVLKHHAEAVILPCAVVPLQRECTLPKYHVSQMVSFYLSWNLPNALCQYLT